MDDEELIAAYVAVQFLSQDSADQFIQDNTCDYHGTELIAIFQDLSQFIQSIMAGIVAAYLYDKTIRSWSSAKITTRQYQKLEKEITKIRELLQDEDDDESVELSDCLNGYEELTKELRCNDKEIVAAIEEAIQQLKSGNRKALEDKIR